MNEATLSLVMQRLPVITHGFVLLLAFFGPWLCPYVLAALFFLTNMGFVTSQVRMAYGMMRCYWAMRSHWKTDWWSFYLRGLQSAPVEALDIRHSPLTLPHLIIVPSYKESIFTLRQTLAILASHPIASHTYNVCLAMEKREEGALEKGQLLAQEFQSKFADIVITVHPADIPGEVPGKGSNTRWAARWMAERQALKAAGISTSGSGAEALLSHANPKDTDAVITIMDADTAFAADYFLAVSVRYLLATPEVRQAMMFVPPIIFDRNQSDVPAVTRVTDIMWSTAGISGIYPSSTIKIPTSAYSMSLALATHVGFWDAGPGAIGEDMHMFCKALFDTNGHLHVETIYSPASQCNVIGSHEGRGYIGAFLSDCHARWSQAVRHMWGSLDTGYVTKRLVTRDFGVSSDRELEHRIHRVEMRRNILETAASDQNEEVKSSIPKPQDGQKNKPSNISRPTIIPQKWIRSSYHSGSPNSASDEETVYEIPTSSASSSFGNTQRPPLTRASSSSHYSYSSLEEGSDQDLPVEKSSNQLDSATRLDSSLYSSTSTLRPQKVKKFPFLVLAVRMYEAHIMLAHLVILLNALILFPKLFGFVERQLARQSEIWGRSSLMTSGTVDSGGKSLALALMGGIWMEQNPILSRTIAICNRLGAIGAASTVVTFLFHDLYHREAGKRWKRNNGYVTTSNPGTMESGHQLQSGNLYLGIPPQPQTTRSIPWCFFDYLAVPGGLVFGVAPLLYAQVCHLWTDRLAYKVSAKPVAEVNGGSASTP